MNLIYVMVVKYAVLERIPAEFTHQFSNQERFPSRHGKHESVLDSQIDCLRYFETVISVQRMSFQTFSNPLSVGTLVAHGTGVCARISISAISHARPIVTSESVRNRLLVCEQHHESRGIRSETVCCLHRSYLYIEIQFIIVCGATHPSYGRFLR